MEEQVRQVYGDLEEAYFSRIRSWWETRNPGLSFNLKVAAELFWKEILD